MAKPTKHALVLNAAPELTVKNDELKKLQQATLHQFEIIAHLGSERAERAIFVGLMLHRVKASLKHGEFGVWQARHIKVLKKSSVNHYMRLANVFTERSKVQKSELLALPGDQAGLSLTTANPHAKKFKAKLSSFVGELSLTELLIKYKIKGVGLQTSLAEPEDSDDDSDLTPAQRAEMDRESAWLDAWNPIQAMRCTLTDPNKLQLITDPMKVEQLKSEVLEIKKLLDDRLETLRAQKI